LRDGGICILIFFADARRQSRGDSLMAHRRSAQPTRKHIGPTYFLLGLRSRTTCCGPLLLSVVVAAGSAVLTHSSRRTTCPRQVLVWKPASARRINFARRPASSKSHRATSVYESVDPAIKLVLPSWASWVVIWATSYLKVQPVHSPDLRPFSLFGGLAGPYLLKLYAFCFNSMPMMVGGGKTLRLRNLACMKY
jgi:hypothetical protein